VTSPSALYAGHVVHDRTRPKRHHLRYSVFMLLLDLDEIEALSARLRLFSYRGWNLIGFHDRDHLDDPRATLKDEVLAKLAVHGLDQGVVSIRVMTMPRILGKGFNPLTVFFCHDAQDRLVATVHAVRNTFGQRHDYVMPARLGLDGWVEQGASKAFYVSPFLPMDLRYDFETRPPAAAVGVGVDVLDDAGVVLSATFSGERRALTDSAIVKAFAMHPWQVAGILVAIHWEAIKIVLKGFRYYPQEKATRGLRRPAAR